MDLRRATVLHHLEFHAWATQKILGSVEALSEEERHRDMQTSHSSVQGTLEHTYRTDALWLNRLRGNGNAMMKEVATTDTWDELRKQWAEVQGGLILFAGESGDGDWSRVVDYRMLSGAEARSPIYESLLHVVNHGTYHRGQVVTMMRQLGAEPVATDFIRFVWTTMQF